ncbi:MAG: divalent-cation tolerance protein CutA [Bacteroidetes bacterium]|nr:divalent-cation tolerance protein CutA [Bacteroidota bacterium]
MKQSIAYVVTKDKDEAKEIGMELVSSKLAACVNILDNMNSIYWWEGAIKEESETVMIVKTKESLMNEVIAKIKEMHSYSIPCVLFLPITKGNEQYLEWIDKETK